MRAAMSSICWAAASRASASVSSVSRKLDSALVVGRGPFLDDEKAANHPAVARRQKSKRELAEEEPNPDCTCRHDREREPAAIEKPVQRTAVESDRRIEKPTEDSFRPSLSVLRSAFGENARTHEGRESERDQAGGENGHDDGNGELAKDSA